MNELWFFSFFIFFFFFDDPGNAKLTTRGSRHTSSPNVYFALHIWIVVHVFSLSLCELQPFVVYFPVCKEEGGGASTYSAESCDSEHAYAVARRRPKVGILDMDGLQLLWIDLISAKYFQMLS